MNYVTLWLLEIILAWLPALAINRPNNEITGSDFLTFTFVLLFLSAIDIINTSINYDNKLLKRFIPSAITVGFILLSVLAILGANNGTVESSISLLIGVAAIVASGMTKYGLNRFTANRLAESVNVNASTDTALNTQNIADIDARGQQNRLEIRHMLENINSIEWNESEVEEITDLERSLRRMLQEMDEIFREFYEFSRYQVNHTYENNRHSPEFQHQLARVTDFLNYIESQLLGIKSTTLLRDLEVRQTFSRQELQEEMRRRREIKEIEHEYNKRLLEIKLKNQMFELGHDNSDQPMINEGNNDPETSVSGSSTRLIDEMTEDTEDAEDTVLGQDADDREQRKYK